MFRWNSCPRCKGDVWLDRDEYGWYEECLMCGYTHDLRMAVAASPHNERDYTEKRKAKQAS